MALARHTSPGWEDEGLGRGRLLPSPARARRGHGCTQAPTGVQASPQPGPVPHTPGETGASAVLFRLSLAGMRFAISPAVSHQFAISPAVSHHYAMSPTFFLYLFPDRTLGILSVLKFHGPLR